jgi:phosphoketolase
MVVPALTRPELELVDAYRRAANYLSVGQIYGGRVDHDDLRDQRRTEQADHRRLAGDSSSRWPPRPW